MFRRSLRGCVMRPWICQAMTPAPGKEELWSTAGDAGFILKPW